MLTRLLLQLQTVLTSIEAQGCNIDKNITDLEIFFSLAFIPDPLGLAPLPIPYLDPLTFAFQLLLFFLSSQQLCSMQVGSAREGDTGKQMLSLLVLEDGLNGMQEELHLNLLNLHCIQLRADCGLLPEYLWPSREMLFIVCCPPVPALLWSLISSG